MIWCGVDDLPGNLENEPMARTIDRIGETSADNIYIGAAAPCTLTFEEGGVPDIRRLTPFEEGESTIGTLKLGDIRYRAEDIEYESGLALPEGLYILNNYTADTYELMNSTGSGVMYWYDLILNVQTSDAITSADAYVQTVTKGISPYFGDYETKRIIAFKNQVPIIINDRTMVPMRDIFEELNCSVAWNGDTQTIIAESGADVTITLEIGSNIMIKNGSEIVLDTPPQIINNSTMVPVRAISEALDLTVDWNGTERIVSIIKDER